MKFKVGDMVKTAKPTTSIHHHKNDYYKTGVINLITGVNKGLFWITGCNYPYLEKELILLPTEYKVYRRKNGKC